MTGFLAFFKEWHHNIIHIVGEVNEFVKIDVLNAVFIIVLGVKDDAIFAIVVLFQIDAMNLAESVACILWVSSTIVGDADVVVANGFAIFVLEIYGVVLCILDRKSVV